MNFNVFFNSLLDHLQGILGLISLSLCLCISSVYTTYYRVSGTISVVFLDVHTWSHNRKGLNAVEFRTIPQSELIQPGKSTRIITPMNKVMNEPRKGFWTMGSAQSCSLHSRPWTLLLVVVYAVIFNVNNSVGPVSSNV